MPTAVDIKPSRPASGRLARIVITAFLLFNLAAIASWAVPVNLLFVSRFKDSVRPYMLWSGLFQSWEMFAPDPRSTNVYVEAWLTYQDGKTSVWSFPRMEQLGYYDRYQKERYRKWANDSLRLDSNSALWPDAAAYIARLNNRPGDPPRSVRLVRCWSDIPAPGQPRNFWRKYVFFTYNVPPEVLK
jgi:hypothetical protein